MDMSGMTMSTTTSAMSMATSSSSSSMDGMDMSSSSSSMMMASDMAMVFFQAVTTPLYSSAWTPGNSGQYAATCVFLIALAAIHRLLMSLRAALAATVWSPPAAAPLHGDNKLGESESAYSAAVGASRMRNFRAQFAARPFKIAHETARAFCDVIVGGIGYLLMLGVMTMNVGYFLSVLGGIFLGSFLVGRFGPSEVHL